MHFGMNLVSYFLTGFFSVAGNFQKKRGSIDCQITQQKKTYKLLTVVDMNHLFFLQIFFVSQPPFYAISDSVIKYYSVSNLGA